jgi:hypothetical protein
MSFMVEPFNIFEPSLSLLITLADIAWLDTVMPSRR